MPARLPKVGSTYYFRRAVPPKLRPYFLTERGQHRAEFMLSLDENIRNNRKGGRTTISRSLGSSSMRGVGKVGAMAKMLDRRQANISWPLPRRGASGITGASEGARIVTDTRPVRYRPMADIHRRRRATARVQVMAQAALGALETPHGVANGAIGPSAISSSKPIGESARRQRAQGAGKTKPSGLGTAARPARSGRLL